MRRRSTLFRLAAALLLFTSVTAPAYADLIPADVWAGRDGRLTTDTATGLSWLDLSMTNDRSYADVFVNDFGGLLSLGFRGATLDEVTTLLHDAGAPPGPIQDSSAYPDSTYASAQSFISLFDCTSCGPDPTNQYSEGYVISDVGGARFAWGEISAGVGGFGMSGSDQMSVLDGWGRTHHQYGSGFYLVMDTSSIHGLFPGSEPPPPDRTPPVSVGEPGTLSLLGVALLALGCLRQRARCLAAAVVNDSSEDHY